MSKRKNPEYIQTCGMLPRALVADLKFCCFKRRITQSIALEEAVKIWVEDQEKNDRQSENLMS